jgi:hypothetical protein
VRCSSSNVKGIFLADGTAKTLKCLCTHHQKHFIPSKCGFHIGSSLNGTEMSSHLNLEQAEREPEREKQSSDWNIFSGNSHRSGWSWKGAGPKKESLCSPTNMESLGCDVTVDSPPLELGVS